MELLTQNNRLSVEDIEKKIHISRRSIYRYLDAFREMGFVVKKEGNKYRLDHTSPFFRTISSGISFSEDEGVTISNVLNSVYNNSAQIRHLREKFANLYRTDVLVRHGVDNHIAQNISNLFLSIREERVVVLKNYTSPSSGKVSNRIVEPYLFANDNAEVRCLELSTQMNKTFKVSRCESVEVLDLLWTHKELHAPYFTDLFGFGGEDRTKVTLLLGQLATSVLLEEYPDAQRQLSLQSDGRHCFETEVCCFKGIGRFVLGLFEDIEIQAPDSFADYIGERAAAISRKFGK